MGQIRCAVKYRVNTGCPIKNTAVASCFSSATAAFFMGHPVCTWEMNSSKPKFCYSEVILNSGQVPIYHNLFSDNTEKIEAIGKILMTKFKLFNDKNVTMCTDSHVLLQLPLQNWN